MGKMKFLALLGAVSAIHLRKADLPHDGDLVEKLDPLSRYVNDADIVQLHDDVNLVQLEEKKADLPHDGDLVEKLDPPSRYVNDADIVQLKHDVNLVQLEEKKAALPH